MPAIWITVLGNREAPWNLPRTHFVKPNQPTVIARSAHPHLSLRGAQRRGNLVAVAMVICRRVFNLNEIANPRIKYGVAMTN